MSRKTCAGVVGSLIPTAGRRGVRLLESAEWERSLISRSGDPALSRRSYELLPLGGGGQFHGVVTRVLLDDRQQPCVEEPDLEEHQERDGAEDAVGLRVEHGGREVEAERELDDRLHH